MLALACRAKQGRFSRFHYFRRDRYPVSTTRKTPPGYLLRLTASGVARLSSFAPSRGGGAQKRDGLRRSSFERLAYYPCEDYIISCYEKVKGEISLFRDIVDLLKVLSMFFVFIDNCLLSVGIGYVGRCW